MKQDKKLEKYCSKMLLTFVIEESILEVNNKQYQILDSDIQLFDENFEFIPFLLEDGLEGWVYEFGGRWYTQVKGENVTLTELKNIGESRHKLPTPSFLGIHSGYELLNGVSLYRDWVAKAKFLGIKTLGMCEKNTLAGVIAFQGSCKAKGIKPIIGMTLAVKKGLITYDIKLYAKSFQGWLNLLYFNEIINVQEKFAVDENILLERLHGIYPVIDPKTTPFEWRPNIQTFYQLDTVIYENEEIDTAYIDNLEKYIASDLEPVLINDAYYIEQVDWTAREMLWGISKKYDYKTKNQYLKNNDQYAEELITMFDSSDKSWIKLFKTAAANTEKIVEKCNYEYDTVNRRLPRYIMSPEEAKHHKTREDLFLHLIKTGFVERKIAEPQKYIDRLKEEIRVLKKGDVIDYFLVLHDIIQFANRENILVGIGRGSAGGSLVSYLLGIIQIDPLEFDLLFERFLNDGRMGEYIECDAYKINDDLILNEGSMVKVEREGRIKIIFVEELREGDIIKDYN